MADNIANSNNSVNSINNTTLKSKGLVISGEFGKIILRQRSGENIELGELLVADTLTGKIILQAYDLFYGSQISQQNLELVSGLKLEYSDNQELEFMDPKLRNYTLAALKPMIATDHTSAKLCKLLPDFFSSVREITKDDLKFLTLERINNPLYVGKLRSGSKMLDVDIFLPGDKVFSHHILIPAQTGKGKSNLASIILWNQVDKDYCGILVLDPHDEYYGRAGIGLKDHPQKQNVAYYTPKNPPPGAKTLVVNIRDIKPGHFYGTVEWSDPQLEGMTSYFREYGVNWIEAIIQERPLSGNIRYNEATIAVLRRRLLSMLDLEYSNNKLYCGGVFDLIAGQTTIKDICNELEQAKTVIIDTSSFGGSAEILIGSLVASEIFSRYKYYKLNGLIDQKPVISVILEEAPRVLGKEVLERGSNIFGTIAREGRKFKVGLTAITQLPSLIPREILANMNTKIILGIEMAPERQAIIDSASQDLSTDNRNIAALDKGEAIITSNFTKFATPIKIPLFEDVVRKTKAEHSLQNSGIKREFGGVNLQ
ncbi:ATP-binding protein [Candidatus Woesearchaeota archaeon]|nr:ATP-binding protein [Candidatus Woesearchaeota archaeon]